MLWKFALLSLLIVNVLGIRLGITKDFGDNDKIFSYSSIIRFRDGPKVPAMTNERVANLLRIAYAEMLADHQQRRYPADKLPGTMIAFVTEGNEIYFASSMKDGRNIFVQVPSDADDPLNRFDKIRRMLKACQFGTHPNDHNYYGRCGEPSMVEMYMNRHNGLLVNDQGPLRVESWRGMGSIRQSCPHVKMGRMVKVDMVAKHSSRESYQGLSESPGRFQMQPARTKSAMTLYQESGDNTAVRRFQSQRRGAGHEGTKSKGRQRERSRLRGAAIRMLAVGIIQLWCFLSCVNSQVSAHLMRELL